MQQRKNPELYAVANGSSSGGGGNGTSSVGGSGTSNGGSGASSAAARPARVVLPRHRPEVLAPAGGWPQLQAAVENGADAVYFGLSDFNARARAANFDPAELPAVMEFLHSRGCRGYVVVNVLCFDSELATVAQRARQMAAAGVDAVIVQDLGVVELLRAAAPGLPIHGSTQMSITSPEGAEFARQVRL